MSLRRIGCSSSTLAWNTARVRVAHNGENSVSRSNAFTSHLSFEYLRAPSVPALRRGVLFEARQEGWSRSEGIPAIFTVE